MVYLLEAIRLHSIVPWLIAWYSYALALRHSRWTVVGEIPHHLCRLFYVQPAEESKLYDLAFSRVALRQISQYIIHCHQLYADLW